MNNCIHMFLLYAARKHTGKVKVPTEATSTLGDDSSSLSKSKDTTPINSTTQSGEPPEKKLKLETNDVVNDEADQSEREDVTREKVSEDPKLTKRERNGQDESMDIDESPSKPATSTTKDDRSDIQESNKSEKEKSEERSSGKNSIIHPFFGELMYLYHHVFLIRCTCICVPIIHLLNLDLR